MTLHGIVRLARNAVSYLVEFGPIRFLQQTNHRLVDHWHERRLGVETGGHLRLPELGIDNKEFHEYAAIGYYAIRSAIRRIPLPHETVSFVDYGSGKGRAVIVAATFPFRKAVGVEISEQLNDVAKANIARMKHRKAEIVQVVASDAVDFVVEDDVNLIYMANPFRGATLQKVIGNILASYRANPRPIYFVYFNKIHFEQLIAQPGYELIKCIHLTSFYPDYSCGTYVLGAEQ
jgi:SAM-dependent methyltransferase